MFNDSLIDECMTHFDGHKVGKPPVPILGQGSTRTCYAISDTEVLKIQSLTPNFIDYREQTRIEVRYWQTASDETREHLATLFWYDPAKLPRWCVMERAECLQSSNDYKTEIPDQLYRLCGDSGRDNIGWVNRDGERKLVLIDYGWAMKPALVTV